jgi:Xaa-Pro aminopeptidase
MAERSLDAVVAAGTDAVNHLCGYWRYFGSPPAIVVGRDGGRTLVVQVDEAEEARETAAVEELVTYGARGFGLVPNQLPLVAAAVAGLPLLRRSTAIGAAGGGSFDDLLAAQLSPTVHDVAPVLHRIRLVKDEDELRRINAAYELAWIGQQAVRSAVQPGVTEIELFTAALEAAQLAAGEPIAFFSDLLAGVRSAEVCAPIRVAGRNEVAAGDAVVTDIVVGLRGYWGDSADTVGADLDDEVASVREALVAIRERSAALLTPGRTGAEVFESMQTGIEDAFPEGEFPHHGGHGVGLSSFEDPHVIPGDDTPLEAGMVIALEPGVYFSGRFGARVEQLYVVAHAGGVELRSAAN